MARDTFSDWRRTYSSLCMMLTLIYQKLCSLGTFGSPKSKMLEVGWMRYNVLVYQNFYLLRNLLGHKPPYVAKMDRTLGD